MGVNTRRMLRLQNCLVKMQESVLELCRTCWFSEGDPQSWEEQEELAQVPRQMEVWRTSWLGRGRRAMKEPHGTCLRASLEAVPGRQ